MWISGLVILVSICSLCLVSLNFEPLLLSVDLVLDHARASICLAPCGASVDTCIVDLLSDSNLQNSGISGPRHCLEPSHSQPRDSSFPSCESTTDHHFGPNSGLSRQIVGLSGPHSSRRASLHILISLKRYWYSVVDKIQSSTHQSPTSAA